MVAVTEPFAEPEVSKIELWGWQDHYGEGSRPGDRSGFVQLGHGAVAPSENGEMHGVKDGSWENDLVLCVSGGRYSAKSYAGALRKLFYRVAWPGSRGIIAVPNYKVFHLGTGPALWDVYKAAGLEGLYEFNVTNHEIDYWNGCKDFVISLDNARAPRGPGVADLWADEVADVEEQAFLDLMPAVRQHGYPHQSWFTMTPPSPYHWSYAIFCPEEAYAGGFTDRIPSKPLRGRYVIMYAATKDNPYGGQEEYEKNVWLMGGPDSPLAQRELEGRWTVLQGLVFPGFNPSRFMVGKEDWPGTPTRFVAGVDFGFSTHCAIVVIGMDDAGHIYLMEEFYRHEFPAKNLVNVAQHLQKKYGITVFFCDSADPEKIAALRAAGVPAWGAKKRNARSTADPQLGLGLIMWAINGKVKDGSQRLYVDRSLVHFKAEMAGYVWEDPAKNRDVSERPRKRNDHAIDATRYGFEGMINRLRWDVPDRMLVQNFDLLISA